MRYGLTRRGGMACVTVLLSVGLSACGGEERRYALPDHLCGVAVNSSLIDAFLPPGERIRQEKAGYGAAPGREGCVVTVDGNVVLVSEGAWRKADISAREATSYPGPTMIAGGRYGVWDRGAVAVVSCRAPSKKVIAADGGGKGEAVRFSIEIRVPVPEEGTEAAMRKFIGPYAEAYRKTLPCQEG